MTTPNDRGGGTTVQGQTPTNPVDFAFLVAQTFGDAVLEREILDIFVTQADSIVRDLPGLAYRQQGDVAHRLKGSARGIGAWALAEAAETYEQAAATDRAAAFQGLAAAVDAAVQAIARHRALP